MRNLTCVRELSLAKKMMLVMTVILVLLSLFLSFSSWHLASSAFAEMELKLYARTMENICAQMDATLDAAQDVMTQVARLRALRNLAEASEPGQSELDSSAYTLELTLDNLLSISSMNSTASLTFFNIYLKNGYSCCTCTSATFPYQSFEECCAFLLASGLETLDGYVSTTWIDTTVQSVRSVPTRSIVGMRFIYDSVTLEKVGIMVVGLNEEGLRAIYKTGATDAFLIRSDGYVLSGLAGDSIGQTLEAYADFYPVLQQAGTGNVVQLPDGRNAFFHRLEGSPCYLLYPIDQSAIEKNAVATQFLKQAMCLCAGALAAAVFLVWLSSRSLTVSLVKLKKVVQQVYEGNLEARFQSNQHDEIAYLGDRINDMLEQVEDFFRTQERDAAEKRDLELRLMQAQINPHLLYNTLNSVVWILRQNDVEKAEKLILSLGSFFKLALSRGNNTIPLSDELSMIQYYLQVQNLGRGKAYALQINVPEDLRHCKILRMTLQPFVENAVIHGFSDWRDDGVVAISARNDVQTQQLQIVIQDNGIGILPEDLEALLQELDAHNPAVEHRHYGMYNVERRIQNKFGKAYGIRIESEVGAYTKVTICLPLWEA